MLTDRQIVETHKVLGLAAMHSGGAGDKVAWAVMLLEQGVETEDLAVLASFPEPRNQFEVEDYFGRVLARLGIHRPLREQAIRGYVKATARDVVDAEVAPRIAAAKIHEAYITLDYPNQLSEFAALDDDWYSTHIEGFTEDRHHRAILEACGELAERLNYPELFKT